MKLMTNGPSLLPCLLPGALVAIPLRRSLDHRRGSAYEVWMSDLRGIGSSSNYHNQATWR
jgi:hypothetical protein